MRTTRSWPLLAAGLLTVACGGTGDAGPGETFRLTEVGGRPLPVAYPEEPGCTEEIRSATLELGADGGWEMTMTKRETCGDAVEEDEDVEEGTYTVAGQSYRFTSPRGDGVAPSPGEIEIENLAEGTREGDVLTARLEDGTTVVFRRP